MRLLWKGYCIWQRVWTFKQGERIVSGETVIAPVGAVVGILTGTESIKIDVATDENLKLNRFMWTMDRSSNILWAKANFQEYYRLK